MNTNKRIGRLLTALQLEPKLLDFLRVRLHWFTNRALMIARSAHSEAEKWELIEAERVSFLEDLIAVYKQEREKPNTPVTLCVEDSDDA